MITQKSPSHLTVVTTVACESGKFRGCDASVPGGDPCLSEDGSLRQQPTYGASCRHNLLRPRVSIRRSKGAPSGSSVRPNGAANRLALDDWPVRHRVLLYLRVSRFQGVAVSGRARRCAGYPYEAVQLRRGWPTWCCRRRCRRAASATLARRTGPQGQQRPARRRYAGAAYHYRVNGGAGVLLLGAGVRR